MKAGGIAEGGGVMFWRKKSKPAASFDRTGTVPVIRSGICTGEQVAGFKEKESGRFHEVMLIRTEGDLREFLRLYGIEEAELGREW